MRGALKYLLSEWIDEPTTHFINNCMLEPMTLFYSLSMGSMLINLSVPVNLNIVYMSIIPNFSLVLSTTLCVTPDICI